MKRSSPPHRLPTPARALGWTVVLVAVVLGGCTRRTTPGLPPGTTVEDLPDSESWNARLRTSEDGRPRLEVDAPYLARYDRPDTAYVYLGPARGDTVSTVAVRVYDGAGRLSASVTAREAWVYEADGRLVTRGQVRTSVPGEDGAEVEAETIEVSGDTVRASGRVVAVVQGGPGARIEASRLTLVRGGAFTASGGTTARLGGGVQATVRAPRVSGTAGRVEASGGARVETSGGRRLEAGRVVWDEGAGRFRAPGAFSFDGPGERVRGVGLSASADLSRYSFRNATGEIEVQE